MSSMITDPLVDDSVMLQKVPSTGFSGAASSTRGLLSGTLADCPYPP